MLPTDQASRVRGRGISYQSKSIELVVYRAARNLSTFFGGLQLFSLPTTPRHFIDIPRDASRSALADSRPAATGCVTIALVHQIGLLRSDCTDPKVRADALRFVIHFVGDLHQPLQFVSNNDEGGNCVSVNFFGIAPVEKNWQFESYSPNLHAIWDYAIIGRIKGEETVEQRAASVDGQFSAQDSVWERAGINVDEWA
jgi:hypothetical protein